MGFALAADTGGTFTDIVGYDRQRQTLFFGKTLTTHDLVDGVLQCVRDIGVDLSAAEVVKHGTTHVINAFVQRSGARTALVTTRGFRDVLEIGRANRPVPFDLRYHRNAPLVPRRFCYEVSGRMDYEGRELEPLDEEELAKLIGVFRVQEIEALAVSFINAYVNPVHEQRAAKIFRDALPDVFIATGTSLSREWYEFERASTAVANAYVGPKANSYVSEFGIELSKAGFRKTFYMMASNGGVLSLDRAKIQPVALLESGPVGGCIGAGVYAHALNLKQVVAFDMGGTTAKCAVLHDGHFDVEPTYYVGGHQRGFPVRSPILDIIEVGAGGGSIAAVDSQGRLSVGPRSAGAEPGPVAFGRGGTEPTVTDANVALGRIGTGAFMGGSLKLDVAGASRAILECVAAPLGFTTSTALDKAAGGILAMAIATMAAAIKEITIERGLDVREFALFVFGGGGPLHGATLARQLHIPRVIVPPHPGNFSALGMLLADARLDDTRTFLRDLNVNSCLEMEQVLGQMEQETSLALQREFQAQETYFERYAEMRYRGQMHSIRIPVMHAATTEDIRAKFDVAYKRRYGHADDTAPVELVALRVTGYAKGDRFDLSGLHSGGKALAKPVPGTRAVYFPELAARLPTAVYRRDSLPEGFSARGPAIIEDYGATTVVEPNDRFEIGQLGQITIHCD